MKTGVRNYEWKLICTQTRFEIEAAVNSKMAEIRMFV